MSHIDPITGCVVADIFELMTPGEIGEVFEAIDNDTRRWQEELDKTLMKIITDWIKNNPLDYPVPVEQIEAKITKCTINLRSSSWAGELIARAEDGLIYKYLASDWQTSGSFYEPPDAEWNLECELFNE